MKKSTLQLSNLFSSTIRCTCRLLDYQTCGQHCHWSQVPDGIYKFKLQPRWPCFHIVRSIISQRVLPSPTLLGTSVGDMEKFSQYRDKGTASLALTSMPRSEADKKSRLGHSTLPARSDRASRPLPTVPRLPILLPRTYGPMCFRSLFRFSTMATHRLNRQEDIAVQHSRHTRHMVD